MNDKLSLQRQQQQQQQQLLLVYYYYYYYYYHYHYSSRELLADMNVYQSLLQRVRDQMTRSN